MKLFDLMKISFVNLRRNKYSLIVGLLVFIATISIIFGISFSNSSNNYWIEYVEKNIDFRIFAVYYEDIKDKKFENISKENLTNSEILKKFDEAQEEAISIIKDVPHIEGVTTVDGYMAGIETIEYSGKKVLGGLSLIGVPSDTYINTIDGKTLKDYGKDENVMICPNYFHSDLEKFDSNKSISSKYLLNETLKLSFSENKILDYKIIGLYDKISTYAIGNACYTSYENIKEIKHDLYLKNKEINSQYASYNGEGLYLMIDNRENLKMIEDELSKYGIYIEPIVYINTEIIDNVLKICSYITIVLLIVTGIIVLMNLLMNIQKRKDEFYLYNVLGYSKLNISKLIISENIIVGIFSLIFAVFLSMIVFELFENIVLSHNSRLYLLNISLGINSIIYGVIISLIIPIISSLVILITNFFDKNKVME